MSKAALEKILRLLKGIVTVLEEELKK